MKVVFTLTVDEGPEFLSSLNDLFEKDAMDKESINKSLERKEVKDIDETNSIISYTFRSSLQEKTPYEILKELGIVGEEGSIYFYNEEYKKIVKKFIYVIRPMKVKDVRFLFHPRH